MSPTASLSVTERVLAISLVASAALLAGAHFFERVVGLVPCVLCLDQREAHWAALAVALAGLVSARVMKAEAAAAAAVGASALVYAVSAGLAFYHTGVEYEFWPGPALCAAGGGDGPIDVDSLTAALEGPVEAPACDDVQWAFLGVSMAGYNLLASAGLFALTLGAALAETRAAQRARTKPVEGSV